MAEIDLIYEIISKKINLRGNPARFLAVGVSGGSDSLALCFILHDYAVQNDLKLYVLSVNHGLRSEAKDELKQLGDWLAVYGIEHHILNWEGKKPKKNIQQEARFARYKLMGRFCAKHEIDFLFLAHHQGDQAENFMIRLCRGSGVDGLSAMQEKSSFPVTLEDVPPQYLPKIIRPLLGVGKKFIEDFLSKRGQEWIDDPSNKNQDFKRVQVRSFLKEKPLEGLDILKLAATAQRMAGVRDLLDSLADDLEKQAVTIYPEGYAKLDLSHYQTANLEIARRVLARLLKKISGNIFAPRQEKMDHLDKAIRGGNLKGRTVGECFVTQKNNKIIFFKEIAAIQKEDAVLDQKYILWDRRFWIKLNKNQEGVIRQISEKHWQDISAERRDEFKQKLSNGKYWSHLRLNFPITLLKSGEIILPVFKRDDKLQQNWLLF